MSGGWRSYACAVDGHVRKDGRCVTCGDTVPVADTPTPTAQDWERLGAGWCDEDCAWEWVGTTAEGTVASAWHSRFGTNGWWVALPGRTVGVPSEDAAYAFAVERITAALVLLAAGVLSAGAQQQ